MSVHGSNSMSTSAKAVQFIFIDESNQFSISKEARSILSKTQNKVAFVTITGMYRTGKSYVMNLMAGDTDAFKVDQSVHACTRGLWFYKEPITIERDGEIMDVFIMDSEGLGGVDKHQNYDVKIFTLASLLSSFLIYNSIGVIDEAAITNLGVVTQIAKNIQIKRNEADDPTKLQNYFPRFLWLLRDFTLELKDEAGQQLTTNEYLEFCLKEQEGFSQKVNEKNRIRNLIKTYFKDRHCFTLIRPVDKEKDLQNLASGKIQLKEEFLAEIEALQLIIFNRIKPVLLNGIPLKGSDYLVLAQNYLDSINKGAIPVISDAWTEVVETQLQSACQKGIKYYQKEIKAFLQQNMNFDLETLSDLHKSVSLQARSFLNNCISQNQLHSYPQKTKFFEKLETEIKDVYKQVKGRVVQEIEKQSKDQLQEMYRDKVLSKQSNDLHEYFSCWKEFEEDYCIEEQPIRYKLFQKFMLDKMTDGCIRVQKQQESKRDLQVKQLELEIGRLNTLLEMQKGQNVQNYNTDRSTQVLEDLQSKLKQSNRKENELKMNVLAYQELVERKDQEIAVLQEQLTRAHNAKNSYAIAGRDIRPPNRDRGEVDYTNLNVPQCGNNGDCVIF